MTKTIEFEKQTKALIDDLKSVCANYGLGNDGNEFKIITQVFLYKYLNDKFIHEVKQLDDKVAKAENWEKILRAYSKDDYEMMLMQLSESTARIQPDHFISTLFEKQNEPKFAKIFDNTLLDIAKENSDIFSVLTDGGEKIVLELKATPSKTGMKEEVQLQKYLQTLKMKKGIVINFPQINKDGPGSEIEFKEVSDKLNTCSKCKKIILHDSDCQACSKEESKKVKKK